jgi:hypothetical protein
VQRYENFLRYNCQRKIFFLILYEMGMDDKAVRRIMGITQEAIRSTRYTSRDFANSASMSSFVFAKVWAS